MIDKIDSLKKQLEKVVVAAENIIPPLRKQIDTLQAENEALKKENAFLRKLLLNVYKAPVLNDVVSNK